MSTIVTPPSPAVMKRDSDDVWDYNGGSWYLSGQATAIKYGILFGILLLGFLVIFGSWFHARQRLLKGLPPLAYHRWLVPRAQRAQFEPHLREPEQNFSFYGRQQGDGYDMHAVPPPVYNPHLQQPPAYTGTPPPAFPDGSKANPFQDPPQRPINGEGSSNVAPPLSRHDSPPVSAPGYLPHPPPQNPPQYS